MINSIIENLSLFNKDYCFLIEAGNKILIEEKKSQGKGTCSFTSQHPVLMMKAKDKNSCVWMLSDQKCAEGAFLEITDDNRKILHIIEMKSKCDLAKFYHVCLQLEGMYFSALAVMAILNLGHPDEVITYLAYTSESLSNRINTPLIANKVLVGSPHTPLKMTEEINFWANKYIKRKHLKAKLVTGERNNGDYDFGII